MDAVPTPAGSQATGCCLGLRLALKNNLPTDTLRRPTEVTALATVQRVLGTSACLQLCAMR